MSLKQPEMSRPHNAIHRLVRGEIYSFFFLGGTTQSGLFGLALGGGGDFLAGAGLGAALARLFEEAVPPDFFLGSALASGRFLFRLDAGRVVSVSGAFAFDFDLLDGALASAGSAAGRRVLRPEVDAGSSDVRDRLAALPDLVLLSSAGAVDAPDLVLDFVADGAAGESPAFGVGGVVPR